MQLSPAVAIYRTFSFMTLLLGSVVLLGWYTQNTLLIQVHPTFVPMQYNTALGFVLAAAGFMTRKWHHCASGVAVMLALLGGATLMQYVFEVDLGLDQLFMEHYVTTKTFHPGRMAPNTALCFLLCAVALILFNVKHWKSDVRQQVVFVISGVILALGTIALAGYIGGVESSYGWGHYTRMAVHTAVGFIMFACALLVLVVEQSGYNRINQNIKLSSILLLLITTTILLWQNLITTESKNLRRLTNEELSSVVARSQLQLKATSQALRRMAQRWRVQQSVDTVAWRSDALNYIEDQPWFATLSIVNDDCQPRYLVKQQSATLVEASCRSIKGSLKDTLTQDGYFSPTLYLTDDQPHLIIGFSLDSGHTPRDYLLAVVDVGRFFKDLFVAEVNNGFAMVVTAPGNSLYGSDLLVKDTFLPWLAQAPLQVGFTQWQISVVPAAGTVKESRTALPELLLVAGVLMSILLVAVIRMWYENMHRTKELEETNSRLDLVLNVADVGMWRWDLKSGELTWDERLRAIYEVSDADYEAGLHYQYWQQRVEPEDLERVERELSAAMTAENNSDWSSRFRIRTPDGRVKHILANGLVESTPDGNRMIGTNVDITQLVMAEDALKESEKRFRAIVENAPFMIDSFDEQGVCQLWNQACVEQLGYTREEINQMQQPMAAFYPDEDIRQQVMRSIENADGQFREFQVKVANGSLRTQNWANFNMPGGMSISFGHDITEMKRLQLHLVELKNAAEAASRAKSQFLANMSHEIRTPMNAILGLTKILLDMELGRKQKDYLQKIDSASNSLMNVLNDILDYSKIEANKLEVVPVDFDLEALMYTTVGLFSLKAEEKGIELLTHIDPETTRFLHGDSLRIGQVLNNLVGNAIKFTSTGFVLVRVHGFWREDNYWVQFSVEDTGIGMDESQLEQLFKPFSQADNTIARRFKGTGLGLSICAKLMELMDGEVDVQSRPGQGSKFSFNIPIEKAREPMQQSYQKLKPLRTLVVDDNRESLLIIKSLLESWDFDVCLAQDGETAIDLLTDRQEGESEFELLLVDWQMPGMDGMELIGKIQHREDCQKLTSHLVVIMVTAFGRNEAERAAQSNRIDAIVDKPILASHLYDVIAKIQYGSLEDAKIQEPSTDNLQDYEALKGAYVLLVEDNTTNQLVASEFLDKLGIEFDIANNGEEACQKVQEQQFDAILMDLHMPVMGGIEATARIRERLNSASLPIIAMTAAALDSDRQNALEQGLDDHIAKPLKLVNLAGTLMKWLAERQQPLVTSPTNQVNHKNKNDGAVIAYNVKGLDLVSAVELMNSDWQLLRKVLLSFKQAWQDGCELLASLLAEGDITTLQRQVHTLKSNAASIGAAKLEMVAQQVESLAKQREAIDLQQLNTVLAEVLTAIEAAQLEQWQTDDPAAVTGIKVSDTTVVELVDKLGSGMYVNGEYAANVLNALGEHLDGQAKSRILAYIENLSYQSAVEAIKKAISLSD